MTHKVYKQTELGVIPENWEVKELGEIATFAKGQGYSKSDLVSNGTPIILYGSMYTNYRTIIDNVKTFAIMNEKSIISKGGEVIVPASGETAEDIAIASYVEQKGVILGGDINIVYPNKECLPAFLANIISHGTSHFDLVNRAQGKTVVHIHNDDLKNIAIPLPPLAEQRAIATVLSDVDALIESLDRLIDKKRKIKQGTMQQLLTGKKRLKGFGKGKGYKQTELGKIPADWEVNMYDDVLSSVNSKDNAIPASDYLSHGKYPVIDQGKSLISGYTNSTNPIVVDNNAGIIIFGDHTRIFKYANFDFMPGADGVQILEAKKTVCTLYLYYYCLNLRLPNTGYNRHFKFLKESLFILPPLAEQRAIATVLSDMDAEIEALEAKRKKYEKIKQGMMQDLLTGRVRLPLENS